MKYTIETRHRRLVADYARKVQTDLNHQAQLGIQGLTADLDQDRIDGLVQYASDAELYDDISSALYQHFITFNEAIVTDTIQKNVEFHAKAGMKPKITRRYFGGCKWCRGLAGTYDYPDVPHDVYRRHNNCRCLVDYYPGNGKKQDVWSKSISDLSKTKEEQNKELAKTIKLDNEIEDKKEYKSLVSVLGSERAPESFVDFQDLKYNKSEKYERIKDNEYVVKKMQSREWSTVINPDKQRDHMESTHLLGKSYLYDSIDAQSLMMKYAGTGRIEKNRKGQRTNKETIKLGFPVGVAVNKLYSVETDEIKIHHSKKRAHIVPKERK